MRSMRELEIFAAVAEARSLTKAARALNVSLPSVSKSISELEEDLGTKLFTRTTHAISLTEVGETFYRRCYKILASLDEARNEIFQLNKEVRGNIRVHAPLCAGQALIAPAIAQFMRENPQINVSLVLMPGKIQLSRFELDLIIRSKTADGSFHQRPIAKLPYVICASPAYLAARPRIEAPYDLATHDCLIHTTQDAPDCWTVMDGERAIEVRVEGSFTSNSSLAVRACALESQGVVRLPSYVVADDIVAGRLVSIFTDRIVSRRMLNAYYPRSSRPPPKILALIDFLASHVRAPEPSQLVGSDGLQALHGKSVFPIPWIPNMS